MPALNEEQMIAKTITSLPKKLKNISKIEILIVNDGSTDKTKEFAEKAGATVVSHPRNLGVGAAFHSAVDYALESNADIMLTIDADGQFDVNEIPALLIPLLKNEADFVTGNRFATTKKPKNMPTVKYWGNKRMSNLISTISGQTITDAACGFRAYSREVLLNLNLLGKFTYTQETILDLCYKGFRLTEVPISVKYFSDRKSRVAGNIWRYATNTLTIIIKSYRDYRPLQFFGYAGGIIFLAGLILDIAIFIHFIETGSFSPYKAFGFLGGLLNLIGVISFILGMLADMLTRVRINQEKLLYFEKKKRYEK